MTKSRPRTKIQGFLNDARESVIDTEGNRYTSRDFEGKRLDEIQIDSTLKSKQDVDTLINFLISSKHCFLS